MDQRITNRRENTPQIRLLPDKRMDWRTLCVSYGAQALLLLIGLTIGILMPEKMSLNQYHATELVALKPFEPPPPPKIKIKVPKMIAKLEPPPVLETPKLVVPKEIRKPKVETPEVEAPKLNNFEAKIAPALLNQNKALPVIVHTGDFAGSSVKPTVNKPIEQVQTGGFGDPNALKGEGKTGAKLVTAQLGSFDMPVGPGQGNGSGGAKGVKGTVASADFGSGVATGGRGGNHGTVQQSGFGAQQPVQKTAKTLTVDAPTTGVEILSKPTPVYTQEARDLKLEGQVLLEILFTADGRVQVQNVVRGLGHGLDEAAIAAASKMRFKPAMRNGQPVDSTAVVHVVFQMAY
jgi:TonB family protein